MSLFEVNNAQESHNNSQSNHNYKDGSSQELSCILTRPVKKQMLETNSIKKAFQKVDCSVHIHDDKAFNDSHEEKVSFINTKPLQHGPCSQSNCNSEGASFFSAEESSTKNLDQHRNHESFPYLCKLSETERKKASHLTNLSCQFNDYGLNTVNSPGNVVSKDKEETETQIVLESLLPEGPSVSQHHVEEFPSNCKVQTYSTSDLNHIKDGNLPLQNDNSDHLHIDKNPTLTRKNQEAHMNNYNQKTETDCIESESLEQDCTLPLWVKWRGKWQTGIRCPKIDCPLSTLKAKPTHDRKKYSIVYFPHTKTYSWADTQLICSINVMPVPLAYGTHINWLSLVEDLTSPRCYIMRKLAISMLNISDQLHTEAVAETARKASYWTDFATEASCCKNYSDLGKMLLRLQSIILPNYINPDRLQDSFDTWLHQCQNAQSAGTIEFLTKQLVDSVLWKDVEELWDAPVQPELGSEWRTWKQEATKLLNTSNPLCGSGDSGKQICHDHDSIGHQMNEKHSKLEIHQSEGFTSETEAGNFRYQPEANVMDTDLSYIHCKDLANSSALGSDKYEASGKIDHKIDVTKHNDLKNIIQTPFEVGESCGRSPLGSELGSQNKYRRCSSFIEAKRRQCGRWASDGEIYCCVHLKGHPVFSSSQAEQSSPIETSLCEGITVHGKNCKHRAKRGSVFCKKHGHHGGSIDEIDCKRILSSSGNNLKRKCEEKDISGSSSGADGGFKNEIQAGNLVSIVIGETLNDGNCLMDKSNIYDSLPPNVCSVDNPCCIGHDYNNIDGQCQEGTKWFMYCEKHLPYFLKHPMDGKSELISKDAFIDLLKSCGSKMDKIYLHRACELLYTYMKNNITHQKSISTEESMEKWVLSEISKDRNVGEFILKLVSNERSIIGRIWGLDTENANLVGSSEAKPVPTSVAIEEELQNETTNRCKICKEEFGDEKTLGTHWMDIHKKEAQWLFRGYACSICLNSFTNKKVLFGHVTEKHGLQFLEHSALLRCMMCNSHLSNLEKLWEHILSFHLSYFKLTVNQDVVVNADCKPNKVNDSAGRQNDGQRFICKSCGLKFDLLPDLGRHHQAAHGNLTSINRLKKNRTNQIKTSKLHHSRFKKSAKSNFSMRKHFQASSSVIATRLRLQTQASETVVLGKLLESHCSIVAETLFAEAHQTKLHPSNSEILAVARSACCQTFIHNALVEKFGTPLRNLYLKAAKFCSELNIPISWHLEEFTCPNGCKPLKKLHSLDPLTLLPDKPLEPCMISLDGVVDGEWEMEECHYILNPKHFIGKYVSPIVLCEDVSFGKEPIPVACVVDENLKHLLSTTDDGTYLVQNSRNPFPWLSFTYVTERLLDPSLHFDPKSSQLGCGCEQKCNAGTCDHVYLFNNDYENAKDVYGKSMQGRFSYDENGRIKLEEGYLVYECNSMCSCNQTCENRVLQNGLQIRLEVFWTQKKGWALRTVKPISQGTFVCEYIGEVLNETEANNSSERYEGCSYLYDTNSHKGEIEQSSEIQATYVIDATKYGNVSRFINHSCSPNLVSYQVLVESMDCQLAHIGLYASRNIVAGEELVYDYQYKLLPGDGCPCHCGSLGCRGRLY